MVKLLVSVTVLLVLLEASARLWLFGPLGLDPRRIALIEDSDQFEIIQEASDPVLSWTYKPDLARFMRLVWFETNSAGLRDREYPLGKPAGTFRVVVMGCSYTVPLGVEIQDAFHSLLEERLTQEFAPRRFEFINFATGAYGPSQILAALRTRALAYEPDLILFCLTELSVSPMLLEWDKLREPRLPVWLKGSGPRSFLWQVVKLRTSGKFKAAKAPVPAPVGRTVRGNVVAKLGEISRETGIPVVVARIEYDTRPPGPAEIKVERQVKEEGMRYVDTRQAFSNEEPGQFWAGRGDRHPNPRAHAIFADVIEAYLKAEGLLGQQ